MKDRNVAIGASIFTVISVVLFFFAWYHEQVFNFFRKQESRRKQNGKSNSTKRLYSCDTTAFYGNNQYAVMKIVGGNATSLHLKYESNEPQFVGKVTSVALQVRKVHANEKPGAKKCWYRFASINVKSNTFKKKNGNITIEDASICTRGQWTATSVDTGFSPSYLKNVQNWTDDSYIVYSGYVVLTDAWMPTEDYHLEFRLVQLPINN